MKLKIKLLCFWLPKQPCWLTSQPSVYLIYHILKTIPILKEGWGWFKYHNFILLIYPLMSHAFRAAMPKRFPFFAMLALVRHFFKDF